MILLTASAQTVAQHVPPGAVSQPPRAVSQSPGSLSAPSGALAAPSGALAAPPAAPEIAVGAEALGLPNPALYQGESPGMIDDRMWTLLTRKIVPILPGALVLFVFSALFGTINFYSELPEDQRGLRRTGKYLVVWTLTNYTFALILLFLILPEDVTLASVTRQLAIYCFAAAALPELSSNIRVQLGKSERSLDLHRYKSQVSSLITRQMQRASHQDQNRERECLENHYANAPDALRQRLVAFVKQTELGEEEQDAVITELKGGTATDAASLIDVVVARPSMVSQVLDFFRDDIDEFRRSPVAALVDGLQPRLTITEATRLVENGVTSRRRFLWRTWLGFQRRRLVSDTEIPDARMRLLRYSTRGNVWHRRWVQIRAAIAILFFLGVLSTLLNLQADRTFVSYVPQFAELASVAPPPSGDAGREAARTPSSGVSREAGR